MCVAWKIWKTCIFRSGEVRMKLYLRTEDILGYLLVIMLLILLLVWQQRIHVLV